MTKEKKKRKEDDDDDEKEKDIHYGIIYTLHIQIHQYRTTYEHVGMKECVWMSVYGKRLRKLKEV